MPRVCAAAQEDRPGGCAGRLDAGRHLAAVGGVDPAVVLAGDKEDGRVGVPSTTRWIGRIGVQRLKVLRMGDRAKLGDIEGPVRVQLDPQHIENADWATTARNRSGRWVRTAPISRPPLLPPGMHSFSGEV